MDVLPTVTAGEERRAGHTIAVLPVGSFEQHGDHLPLTTDTLVACAIASELSKAYALWLLPPLTYGCSHEHAALGATVSVRATTVYALVNDIADSLERSGISRLVVINGHGGNYVLGNVVQEANEAEPRMILYPSRSDWDAARQASGIATTSHDDMHAGELETSILLALDLGVVKSDYQNADHEVSDRPLLLTLGVKEYSKSGVIGRPSLATVEKGRSVLTTLTERFRGQLARLQ